LRYWAFFQTSYDNFYLGRFLCRSRASKCKTRRDIKSKNYSEGNPGHLQFMRQQELCSLVSIFDREIAFGKKT
jgi:hypothetical protein